MRHENVQIKLSQLRGSPQTDPPNDTKQHEKPSIGMGICEFDPAGGRRDLNDLLFVGEIFGSLPQPPDLFT